MVDAGPAGEFNERRERFSRSAFLLLLKEVSMEVLAQALNKTIDTYCELKAGDSVIAAISGGADSMALLDSLRYVAGQRGLVLFAVHVQHHLRGAEAEADAELVQQVCCQTKVQFVRKDVDVTSFSLAQGLSVETAARVLRYEALEEVRQEKQAAFIFLAHHRDDQAETVLLNLLRGAGIKGLAAMEVRNNYLLRPFLNVEKNTLIAYCGRHKLAYAVDSSNFDCQYKRNWVRQKLLPELASVNPEISRVLAQTARLARQDEDCLSAQAAEYLWRHRLRDNEVFGLDVADFGALPVAVASRVVRQALGQVAVGEYNYGHIEAVMQLIAKGVSGKKLTLPQVKVKYAYGQLLFTVEEEDIRIEAQEINLVVPGQTEFANGTIKCDIVSRADIMQGDNICYYPCALLSKQVVVRHRRPGDVFRPVGSGNKKLKKYMIDKKIPVALRDKLWLVACDKQIIWLIGHKTAGWQDGLSDSEYLKLTWRKKNEQK